MASKGWDKKVPVEVKTGSVLHWHGGYTHYDYGKQAYVHVPDPTVEYRDNWEFEDTITFKKFGQGRSAIYMVADSKNWPGRTYDIFLSDVTRLMPLLVKGVYTGRFTHCKRGQNYGTTPLDIP